MAKSYGFFNIRQGSTRSHTFSAGYAKFGGTIRKVQITKDRVTDVKNPRTLSQMRQRAVFNTLVQARKGLHQLLRYSFEGYGIGLKSLSRFMTVNAPVAGNEAVYVGYRGYEGVVAPIPFIVSEGSLPPSTVGSGGVISFNRGSSFRTVDINFMVAQRPQGSDDFVGVGISNFLAGIFGYGHDIERLYSNIVANKEEYATVIYVSTPNDGARAPFTYNVSYMQMRLPNLAILEEEFNVASFENFRATLFPDDNDVAVYAELLNKILRVNSSPELIGDGVGIDAIAYPTSDGGMRIHPSVRDKASFAYATALVRSAKEATGWKFSPQSLVLADTNYVSDWRTNLETYPIGQEELTQGAKAK